MINDYIINNTQTYFNFSDLVIVKQLPEEIYLLPKEDLNMDISIATTIPSEDDIILSLKHSSRGVHKDLTKYIVYKVLKDTDDNEYNQEKTRIWKINMTLPYPYSQASGGLTLSVKDDHSGDVTSTRLFISGEENDGAPFFDPAPKSLKSYVGDDLFIETGVKGFTPLIVSIMIIADVYFRFPLHVQINEYKIIITNSSIIMRSFFKFYYKAYLLHNFKLNSLLFNVFTGTMVQIEPRFYRLHGHCE